MSRQGEVYWSDRDRCWRSSAGGRDHYFRELAPNAAGGREAARLLAERLASEPATPRIRRRKPTLTIKSSSLAPGETMAFAIAAYLELERQRA